jgi:hypothetical protein
VFLTLRNWALFSLLIHNRLPIGQALRIWT